MEKDHIAWEGSNLFVVGGAAKNELEKMNTGENYASIVGANRFDNLFVVGGAAKNELEKMNTGENYASIVGANRFDTIIQVLKNIGKL